MPYRVQAISMIWPQEKSHVIGNGTTTFTLVGYWSKQPLYCIVTLIEYSDPPGRRRYNRLVTCSGKNSVTYPGDWGGGLFYLRNATIVSFLLFNAT
jgi:hypothetical protein